MWAGILAESGAFEALAIEIANVSEWTTEDELRDIFHDRPETREIRKEYKRAWTKAFCAVVEMFFPPFQPDMFYDPSASQFFNHVQRSVIRARNLDEALAKRREGISDHII